MLISVGRIGLGPCGGREKRRELFDVYRSHHKGAQTSRSPELVGFEASPACPVGTCTGVHVLDRLGVHPPITEVDHSIAQHADRCHGTEAVADVAYGGERRDTL